MTNEAVISTQRKKSLAPGIIEFARIIEQIPENLQLQRNEVE